MSQDIPGVFVIARGGDEVLTLTHDGEHLALRTFPVAWGNPVMLDLSEADALAAMLTQPWPVITVHEPGEVEAGPALAGGGGQEEAS